VPGSGHIIIDAGCGDAAILLAEYSDFLRVHAQLLREAFRLFYLKHLTNTPRSANSDADCMGERRNTMEELVGKIGRDGKELARDRQRVEGV
jgi:hypothetical protein